MPLQTFGSWTWPSPKARPAYANSLLPILYRSSASITLAMRAPIEAVKKLAREFGAN